MFNPVNEKEIDKMDRNMSIMVVLFILTGTAVWSYIIYLLVR